MKSLLGRASVAAALILLMVGSFVGCESGTHATSQPGVTELPSTDVALGGRRFRLEIADDEKERETGLMHRTSMPADHGMLFAFPDVQPRQFWMKNTLIGLDIVYLDENGVVLNVEHMFPKDLTGVNSDGPAKYAIELNQGVANQIGLKPGDKVALPATNPE